MKMSEVAQMLLSNIEEYGDKNVFIAKKLLTKNNGDFTFIPMDFKIFYDNRNDIILLIEEKR